MTDSSIPRIGLALGGGGARGLAHIPMLETFDELGLRPHRLSGTSIGSVVGAMYAGGHSGADIRDFVSRIVISREDSFKDVLRKRDAMKIFDFFDLELGRGGLLKGDHFIEYLTDCIGVTRFEELQTPLTIVATDYWTSEQVVLDSGDLPSAIKASMGLPGVFTPVLRDDRVLIDGGGVNPVPHDLLNEDCERVVAVNVMGGRTPESERKRIPRFWDTVMGTFDIMQHSIIAGKRASSPPDLFLSPELTNVDLLDFTKANRIYEQANPSRQELRIWLQRILGDAMEGNS